MSIKQYFHGNCRRFATNTTPIFYLRFKTMGRRLFFYLPHRQNPGGGRHFSLIALTPGETLTEQLFRVAGGGHFAPTYTTIIHQNRHSLTQPTERMAAAARQGPTLRKI